MARRGRADVSALPRRVATLGRRGRRRSSLCAAGDEIDEALDYVQRRKPSADPLPHQREDLRRWWAARGDGGEADADSAGGSG